jgi:hypothetical protein
MRRYSIGSFSNLTIPLLLFFCPVVKRDGCQFNMSTNVYFFFVSLVSQSGCKSRKLISNRQMFFEVFFEKFLFLFLPKLYQSLNELSVFCGVQM